MNENTTLFDVSKVTDKCVRETLEACVEALAERGYNPINQIVGYIISGDLGYISSYKEARNRIAKIDYFSRRTIKKLFKMRYLGIDLGSKTVGLAISDTTLTIASSLKTIFFKDEDYLSTIDEIKNIIKEYDIQKIILGLPKNMNNTLGERAEITTKYKRILEENTNIPVIFFDERLTSVISNSILIEADISRKKRKKKVDSIAAQIILQDYLNKEKNEHE